MRSTQSTATLLQRLAETALETDDRTSYRSAWLAQLTKYFDVDVATLMARDERDVCSALGYPAQIPDLTARLTEYLAEFTPQERLRCMRRHTSLDEDLFSTNRRSALRLYREFLRPLGMATTAVRCWERQGTAYHVFLSRAARDGFSAAELRALDCAFSVVVLGESLHALLITMDRKQPLVCLDSLTPAELTVVTLAQRGLTNSQIATLCAVRPETTRNQLSSAFRKLHVSNRTELAYLLSRAEVSEWPVRGRSSRPTARGLA